MVRRCVHRHTGQELAVKIIEITAEKMTVQQLEEVRTSTLKEIQVLNMVKGHSSISRLQLCSLRNARIFFFFSGYEFLTLFNVSFSHFDRFLRVHDVHIFSV